VIREERGSRGTIRSRELGADFRLRPAAQVPHFQPSGALGMMLGSQRAREHPGAGRVASRPPSPPPTSISARQRLANDPASRFAAPQVPALPPSRRRSCIESRPYRAPGGTGAHLQTLYAC